MGSGQGPGVSVSVEGWAGAPCATPPPGVLLRAAESVPQTRDSGPARVHARWGCYGASVSLPGARVRLRAAAGQRHNGDKSRQLAWSATGECSRGRWPSPGPLATRAVSCLPPRPAPVPSPSTLLPASPSGLVLDSVILRPLACGHGVTPRPTCL